MAEICVNCGDELSILEKNRAECWDCQDRISVTYADDLYELDGE